MEDIVWTGKIIFFPEPPPCFSPSPERCLRNHNIPEKADNTKLINKNVLTIFLYSILRRACVTIY